MTYPLAHTCRPVGVHGNDLCVDCAAPLDTWPPSTTPRAQAAESGRARA